MVWNLHVHPVILYFECFHTRGDSKLQWRNVIAIFELPRVHTREKISPSLRFSIPERGEEAWLIFRHADWCFIWDRISIRKCVVYRQKWLEGHVAPPPKSQFRGQGIHTAISLRYLRDASLEKHLQTVIWIPQFILHIAMLICVHTVQNTIIRMIHTCNSNDRSNCALCSRVKTLYILPLQNTPPTPNSKLMSLLSYKGVRGHSNLSRVNDSCFEKPPGSFSRWVLNVFHHLINFLNCDFTQKKLCVCVCVPAVLYHFFRRHENIIYILLQSSVYVLRQFARKCCNKDSICQIVCL